MLTEEAQKKVFEQLRGSEPKIEPEVPEEVQAEEAEAAPQEQEEVQESSPEEVESKAEEPKEDDHPHVIPYNRFKQVNDERKELRAKADQQEQRINSLQEQVDRVMAGTASRRDAEEVASVFEPPSEDMDWDDWRMSIGKQLEEINIGRAQMELERDIDKAAKDFPDVPADAILQAISNDGNVDVMDFAKSYTEFIREIGEGAVAKYVKEGASKPEVKAKAKAKPRVSSVSSNNQGETPAPKTLEDAQAALLRHLKES